MNLTLFRTWFVAPRLMLDSSNPKVYVRVRMLPREFQKIALYFGLKNISFFIDISAPDGSAAGAIRPRSVILHRNTIMNESDDVLRFIFAHECAHLYKNHTPFIELVHIYCKIVTAMVLLALSAILTVGLYMMPDMTVWQLIFLMFATFFGGHILSAPLIALKAAARSRANEYVADTLAVAAIGNALPGIRFFKKINQHEMIGWRQWYRSHPTLNQRIAHLFRLYVYTNTPPS